ncbi:hypothetical protein NC652_011240 [Populus alba x Populus x berolinensis]|nr:hypothetical protein NC652_011240 [Populus alba x Populus x berolinensis]
MGRLTTKKKKRQRKSDVEYLWMRAKGNRGWRFELDKNVCRAAVLAPYSNGDGNPAPIAVARSIAAKDAKSQNRKRGI